MVTENVDIRFRESGARIIKRRIDEIGEAANRSTRGIFLLQRAIFVLGGAGAVRALTTQADLLTNVENRLRLTTTSAENLEQVQTRLFQVARDSRTSFESVAEIYSRTALSVRELGISQQETARFTESLAKAAILSGASTREANAALIQLSQGLASNRLSGDELRSVLEQLPFVADVIARQLGVTRGELREFGREGKISAEVVLEAFRNAEEEIDRLFSQTSVTIGQSLNVATANWLEFLDRLEDSAGVSNKVARAIIVISENLNLIVGVLATVAAAFSLAFGARIIKRMSQFVIGLRTAGVRTARFAEVTNIRAAAEQRRARTTALATINDKASFAQGVVQLEQNRALLVQQQQSIIIDNQRRVARDALTGRFIAYDAAVAQNVRTNIALMKTEQTLAATRTALTGATVRQTAATAALAGATARTAAAQAASAGIVASTARTFPLLAGAVGAATRALTALWALMVANPIGALITVLTAAYWAMSYFRDSSESASKAVDNNSLAIADEIKNINSLNTLVEDGVLLTVSHAKTKLEEAEARRENIKALIKEREQLVLNANAAILGSDTLLRLYEARDALASPGTDLEQMNSRVRESYERIEQQIVTVLSQIQKLPGESSEFNDALKQNGVNIEKIRAGLKNAVNGIVDLNGEVVTGTNLSGRLNSELSGTSRKAWEASYGSGALAQSLSVASRAAAALVANLGGVPTAIARLAGQVDSMINSLTTQNASLTYQIEQGLSSQAAGIKAARDQAMKLALQNGATVDEVAKLGAAFDKQAAKAESLAVKNANLSDTLRDMNDITGGGGGGEGGISPDFASLIAGYQQEIEVLRLSQTERERLNAILDIENTLKRSLTEAERTLADETLRSLEAAKIQADVLESIIGPREQIKEQQAALNALFEQGRIGLNDYTTALREMQIAADEAAGTLAGSFKSAISSATMSVAEIGTALGGVVVNAADRAANAIVEFAETGKFNFSEFARSIIADMLKIIAKQLILNALGLVFGGTGIGGLLGFSTGGSILPSGPGSTDSQIVSFKKRPDERVDILTPGQQEAQKRNSRNGKETPTVNQTMIFNVTTPDANSFKQSEGQLANRMRRMAQRGVRGA